MTATWKIDVGQRVSYGGATYEITHFLTLKSLMARNLQSGVIEKLDISDLEPAAESAEEKQGSSQPVEEADLGSISELDWNEAERRAEHVKRFLLLPHPTRADADKEAESLGVGTATFYRYVGKYLTDEKVSSLLPKTSSGGRGGKRISEESEKIMEIVINELYLTKQERRPEKVIIEYQRRCRNAGIEPAHPNTLRNRIDEIPERDKVKSRQGLNALRKHLPASGEFPEGDYPFQVVQIDHTPVDLQFVDDVNRLSIGRMFLTVMIEVFSRMILGFYLSPDAPSINSVAMCVSHAVLPKEKYMSKLGVESEWNCWGLMHKIHADNAGEFRSSDLRRACHEYGIDVEWRPVSRPHYGGHIERLLGTFMKEVHDLPGTTYSNIQAKGDRDPEKTAVFTYTEFERWLTTYITGIYHKRKHSGIGMSPEVKFEQGLYVGSGDFGPTGLPPKITDERKFRLDFMPSVERTVQPFGIEVDFIKYYDSVLNPYIGAKDLEKPKYARKFLFKRNPRELEKLYFYHPELKQYFEIPYRNLAHLPTTLWEVKAVRDKLKKDGVKVNSEEQIFEALNKMREIEQTSTTETKSARRKAQNLRIYADQKNLHKAPSTPSNRQTVPVPAASPAVDRKSMSLNSVGKNTADGSYSDFFNISEDKVAPLEVEEF